LAVSTVKDEEKNVRRMYSLVLLGIVLYVILDAVAQVLPPHYNTITQAESDLAVGPYGFIMTINFLNRGLLSLAFLYAFLGSVRLAGADASKFRGGKYVFGVWAVGAILLAIFPTEVPPTPVSWTGLIHFVLAVLVFLGGAFGALLISLRISGIPSLGGVRRFALPLSVLSVIACVVELLSTHDMQYGGLIERIFLGTVLLWMTCISLYMLRQKKLSPEVAESTSAAP
jgi:hypothetical protein